MVSEKSWFGDKAINSMQLLQEYKDCEGERDALERFIQNCSNEIDRLTQLADGELTREQELELSDYLSKLNAAISDIPETTLHLGSVKAKIATLTSVISG